MRNCLAPMLALPLLLSLAACGGGEPASGGDEARATPLSGRQETADGTASLVLPEGFVKTAYELDGQVTFAAQDALDPLRQVFVTTGDSIADAEAEAIFVADVYVKKGATCHRDRTDTTFGATHSIVDCRWKGKQPTHSVMVALGDTERGAMVLLSAPGRTRADVASFVTPVLDSWTWLD
ncbi:hypothetical protein [Nocardioides sp.]|uniref:hypothetical protein n=1 Tax=Nocardioides sp. TaxID=35761 RepID=UPI002B9F0AE1|nr:hypothetical protein [Nocardioides sp.]HSX68299.1 hypothetical protein [Nocardioides sp.]